MKRGYMAVRMSDQKQTFKRVLMYLAILLALLPFLVVFNQVLTSVVETLELYNWVQQKVVPIQSQLIGFLIRPLGIKYIAFKDGMMVNGLPMKMTWNCLGWQSLLFFSVSLVMGLKDGAYTLGSKLQVVVLGLFGIFWVNLFRISLTVMLAAWAMPVFRVVFHDYLAAMTTVLFLVSFWRFSYAYVLELRKK